MLAKRKKFKFTEVEDPFLGITPAEKVESIESKMTGPEFPQFKTLWLVKVCLLSENIVQHVLLPIVSYISWELSL